MIPRIPNELLMAALAGQQQQGRTTRHHLGDGLLATGLSMMANSSTPGATFASSFGKGALEEGIPAFQRSQYSAQEKVALDEMLQGAPPEMQAMLRALGPQGAASVLLQQRMAPGPSPIKLGATDRLVDPQTMQTLVDAVPQAEDLPALVQEYEYAVSNGYQGTLVDYVHAKKSDGVVVNVGQDPSPAQQAAEQQAAAPIAEGFEGARADMVTMGTMDRLLEIVDNPAFRNVSGPIFGGSFGQLRSQFSDDPTARELAAEFAAGGGVLTMAQLEAFTGPKTDFEFRQSQRLAMADPTMTVEEIKAGLAFNRRVVEDRTKQWAASMLEMDPATLGVDPALLQPQMDLARRIQTGDTARKFNLPQRPPG